MKGFISSPVRRRLTPTLAVAACCVGLSTSAMAQNGPGLIAQTRPNTTTTTFNDYDWTGLTYDFFLQVSNNYLHDDSHWFYDGTAYNQWGGNDLGSGNYWFYSFGGLNSYGSGYNRGGKIQVSGSSTFKWQWFPPAKVDDPTKLDFDSFPVPGTGTAAANPLYMLSRVQGDMIASGDISSAQTNGTSIYMGSGQLLDEWTLADNPNLSKFSGLVPPTLGASTLPNAANNTKPTHGVIRAALDPADAANTTLLSTVSPTPIMQGTMNSSIPNYYSNDFCYLQLALETHSFVMELGDTNQPSSFADNGGAASLDLFKYAGKRGDGGNQFVYNKAGNLYLPAGVNLNGAPGDVTPDDTYFLVHNCAQIVTDIVYVNPAPFTFTPTMTGAVPRAPIVNGTNYDGLVYQGLPASNAGLGNHIVKLQINTDPRNSGRYVDSEIAHIQTFFVSGDRTHPFPSGTDDEKNLPNWFYYYSQQYLPPDGNASYARAADLPDRASQYNPTTGRIYLADDAINNGVIGGRAWNVFGLNAQGIVTWLGNLQVAGILGYIAVAAHEEAHYVLGHTGTGDGVHFIQVDFPTTDAMTGLSSDANKDGLDDVWQRAHHFGDAAVDEKSHNVTGLGDLQTGLDAHKENREALCDILALGELIRLKSQWQNDWAKEGLQFGLRPPSSNPNRPFFPWVFYPRVPGSNSEVDFNAGTDQLPANCLFNLNQL